MEDFNSETDSDYTSYWRDWVRIICFHVVFEVYPRLPNFLTEGCCKTMEARKWFRMNGLYQRTKVLEGSAVIDLSSEGRAVALPLTPMTINDNLGNLCNRAILTVLAAFFITGHIS